ncbi:PAS domain-containing protein [Leptolyngbya sp. AN03gr2]|uniref:PAS domain-containing protein n=1 Tax=unclassified Leptolyngbya TaxID=2650499 RepID=UPI003D31BEF9
MSFLILLLGILLGIFVGYLVRYFQVRSLKPSELARYNRAVLVELAQETGFAEWNLKTLAVKASKRQAELYALGNDRFEGHYQQYLEFVHPDHRVRLDQAIQGAISSGNEFELDFCIVDCDGEERWLRSKGKVLITGRNPMLIEMTRDVTRINQLQSAYRRQETKWRTLMQSRVELVVVLDENNCIAYVNSTIEGLLGASADALLGEEFLAFVHPRDRSRVAQTLKAIHQSQKVDPQILYRLQSRQNDWVYLETIVCDERSIVGGLVLRSCKVNVGSLTTKIPRSSHS